MNSLPGCGTDAGLGDGCLHAAADGILFRTLAVKRRRASRSDLSPHDGELVRVALFRSELRRFLARTEQVTRRAGLTPQRYDLLLLVEAAGEAGVRVTDLCELLQMKQPAVTELVKRAVTAKLIERQSSPDDGRVRVLTLTAIGRRQLLDVFDALRGDRAALTERFEELGLRLHASSE